MTPGGPQALPVAVVDALVARYVGDLDRAGLAAEDVTTAARLLTTLLGRVRFERRPRAPLASNGNGGPPMAPSR